MTSWSDLPAELKVQILREVVNTADLSLEDYVRSKCAAVCRDWQILFEEDNFSSLTIHSTRTDLALFDLVYQGDRRKWLRRLRLHVWLPAYPVTRVRRPETEDEEQANYRIFTKKVWKLFNIMSLWDCQHPGIELELSVSSPSDRDQLHGEAGLNSWGEGRYSGGIIDLDFDTVDLAGERGFPMPEVITKLCVLRRTRRYIHPAALATIMQSLPRLTHWTWEPWHGSDEGLQEINDADTARSIPDWPRSLRVITLFQHCDAFVHQNEEDPAQECPLLADNLVRRSEYVEELYCANMSDAQSFFVRPPRRPRIPLCANLRKLALTSGVIHCDSFSDDINNLLQAAGRAIRQMPALQVLELWNYDKASAGAFTCIMTPESCDAGWKSTWAFKIQPRVKATWQRATRGRSRRDLVFAPEQLLPARKYLHKRNAARFLRQLYTGPQLVHPSSLVDMESRSKLKVPLIRDQTPLPIA